ncbi:hypothetical protein D3C86_1668340 [compost metagenome]
MHYADCAVDQRQRQPQQDKTVGQGLAGEADFLADVEHQRQENQAEGDDDGGVHELSRPSDVHCFGGSHREQARSHIDLGCSQNLCSKEIPCGSELARDWGRCGLSVNSVKPTRHSPAKSAH